MHPSFIPNVFVLNITFASTDEGKFEITFISPPSSCCLEVISFYEPLKPFVVIVVEVAILVAAILLFEKSRSKKKPTEGSQDVKH